MNSKEDILIVDLNVDIDPTILLGLEFEKINLVSELDVESVLSEGDNKIIESNNTSNDLENQDSQSPDMSSKCDIEDTTLGTELERIIDINGNEEILSDYYLNWLFCELELSDSDNEEKEEKPSPRLRKRGGKTERRSKKKKRGTNYLNRSDKYDKSQFDQRNLMHLARSSCVDSNNAPCDISFENNHSSAFYPNEMIHNGTSKEYVWKPFLQFNEDSRANSIGSPESGYESSSTKSPPPILSTFNNNKSVSQLDDDQFINLVMEDPAVCALTDHAVPKEFIDNRDGKERINELIEYLKNTSSELIQFPNPVGPSSKNTDISPMAKSFEDINQFAIVLPPILKNPGMPKKLGYKLKEEAKKELRRILSEDKFCASEEKIFKRLIEDKKENRPIKVIYVIDENDKSSEIRTNLHHAVLKQNIEEIYCLVEIQKIYDLGFSDLNIRDKYGKTALDYAIQKHMHHAVIDYLKENEARQNIII